MAQPQPSEPASIGLARQMAQSYDEDNRGIPRLMARYLLTLIPPIESTSVIHDNASGPAVVTSEILALKPQLTDPPKIIATDITPSMIATTRSLIEIYGWRSVTAIEMDSCKLTFDDETFTHTITNLGIFMTADPDAAAAEVRRTLKVGGTAVATAWKFHGFLDLMRRISKYVRPNDPLGGILATSWKSQEDLEATMMKAGFAPHEIEISHHSEKLRFEDLKDLTKLMTGKISNFVTKDWSEEQVGAIPQVLSKALTEEEWTSRSLVMDAWVVIARKDG